MNNLLDTIFSMVIGGIVVILIQALLLSMRMTSGTQAMNTDTQTNLASVTDIIENDFRKIGYRITSPADSSIRYADTGKIIISGDIDNNGTVDSVRYYLGSVRPPANVNPRSRYLYRRVNTSEQIVNVGITRFYLVYYDSLGNQLTAVPSVSSPKRISSLRLMLNVESTFPYDTVYAGATYEQMFKPKNMR